MIAFTITSRPDGSDVAEADYAERHFQAVSRNGASMALARQLGAVGAPDGPWQAVGADGAVRFAGRSLHRLAGMTIEESDGLRIRGWRARETMPEKPGGEALGGLEASAATQAPPTSLAACSTASVAEFQLIESIEE